MAEMLVRIQDKAGFDPKANALSARPGDVIVVCRDGWPWSTAEQTNPDWRIVKMPGVDPSSLRDLEVPAFDALGNLLLKRAKKLDLAAPVFSTEISKSQVVTITDPQKQSDVLAAKVTKETAITVG